MTNLTKLGRNLTSTFGTVNVKAYLGLQRSDDLNPVYDCRPESPGLHPNEIPDKHKNKLMWWSYFFIFRRLKTTLMVFPKKYFYKQHQANKPGIKNSSIKKSQNKNILNEGLPK